ncbi:MAG: cupin [Streptosporangiaceae bacterium]
MEDLNTLSQDHLAKARTDPHGRSAQLFLNDGPLRQTVIALTSGSALEEHNAPPAASVQVLQGQVRLSGESGNLDIAAGQVHAVPQERHAVTALADSVIILTTVTNTYPREA